MKTHFYIAISLFLFGFSCFGQGFPCLNGINTNYNNSSAAATALPTNPASKDFLILRGNQQKF
jgi:hypothetical protein